MLLAERPWLCKGKYVLEVGCAAALPAVVAARLGARCVVASDTPADPGILENAQRNFDRNALGDSARVLPHKWGQDATPLIKQTDGKMGFDLVIASECLWLKEEHSNLLDSICSTLRRPSKDETGFNAGVLDKQAAGTDGFAVLEGGRIPCAILSFCHHDGPGSGTCLVRWRL